MNEVKEILSKDGLSLYEIKHLIKLKISYIKWSLIIFILLAFVITFTTEDEYTATSKFLLESSVNSGNNQLRGLAGIAGVNLPQIGDQEINIITPDLYPSIASSDYFLARISNAEYILQSGEKVTLTSFFSNFKSGSVFTRFKKFVFRIPSYISGIFTKSPPILNAESTSSDSNLSVDGTDSHFNQIASYSSKERVSISELKSRIILEFENKILTVKVKMPEAYLSAQVNKEIIDQFITYVTDYHTRKKSKNLEFLEVRVKETEKNFLNAQMELATFRDRNFGIVSASEKTKEQRLNSEFNLAFNIYNSIALEYEKAKIEFQNEIPVFTVFEPVTQPTRPSEPILLNNLVIFILGGIVVGGFLALLSIFYDYLK